MQGYSLNADFSPRSDALQELARCLRGEAGLDLARYRRLTAAADAHCVRPLLRERLLASRPGADAAIRELRDEALREAALEARRNARLAATLAALTAAGVPSLVFKGTALAHRHYARPELRPRDDTDLLVREAHRDTAHAVLARAGYAAVPGIEGSLIMRQRLYRARDADGLTHNLDLHWAVTNEPRAAAFSPRALLATSTALRDLGPPARAPADAEALLLACLHLDAHHAHEVRLVWLYDVDRMVRAMTVAQRRDVDRDARARGLAGACAWVLTMTRVAFDTPLSGFDDVLGAGAARAPSPRRGARWLRDLSRLADSRQRLQWLGQHLFPPAEFLETRFAPGTPAWQHHARRALRGIGHLLRR